MHALMFSGVRVCARVCLRVFRCACLLVCMFVCEWFKVLICCVCAVVVASYE